MSRQRGGGGGGTLKVSRNAGTINESGNPTSPSGLTNGSVSFTTTRDNEVILFSWAGSVRQTSGFTAGASCILYYRIDAGSDVEINVLKSEGNAVNVDASFAIPITIPTAGAHSIDLRYASSVLQSWDIRERAPYLTVTQVE